MFQLITSSEVAVSLSLPVLLVLAVQLSPLVSPSPYPHPWGAWPYSCQILHPPLSYDFGTSWYGSISFHPDFVNFHPTSQSHPDWISFTHPLPTVPAGPCNSPPSPKAQNTYKTELFYVPPQGVVSSNIYLHIVKLCQCVSNNISVKKCFDRNPPRYFVNPPF